MTTPYDFLDRLPASTMTGEFERSPGVNINGTFAGNALVNVLSGTNVPTTTYTVGIGGRGSLVMEEQEYRDLLSSMLFLFEARSPGFISPLDAPVAQQTDR